MSKAIEEPLVSVCITTYKRPQLVKNAIKSVVDQTYRNLEIIIVEDGMPTDNLVAWIRKVYPQKDIKYKNLGKNKGLSAARNCGIKYSSGEYITFLDDDDEWDSKRIELQIAAINRDSRKHEAYYCGNIEKYNGEVVVETIPWMSGDIMSSLLQGWTPPCSASFFTREALVATGGFDELLNSSIDHDIWFSLGKMKYSFNFTPHGLVYTNPKNHGMGQITTDLSRRLDGTNTLCKKWKKIIIERYDTSNYYKFRHRCLAREYYVHFTQSPPSSYSYFQGVTSLIKCLYHFPTYMRTWLSLAIWLISGRYGYQLIQWVKVRIFYKKPIKSGSRYQAKQTIGIPGL